MIGTHRMIGKDVTFKNLGLMIIDEEQRFGVRAKEHFKTLKEGIDCLALSATPIPRTLYMSLVGARDISLIHSPPRDRVPVKTIIAEEDLSLIRKAILRELARDGQVFVIHNRVETIYEYADRLKETVPEMEMVVGHGQMSADALDDVFHAFKEKRANVLVSTTIIESGIDIPAANTILIDRADRFGLADLYQLRGRVGRWNRKAYAYLLVPPNKVTLETAQKRLAALVENSGFGGGMKIAMKDLEIRGGGEILGSKQSGHVSAIGFHLYCKLLKRTILTLQGKAPKVVPEVRIHFPVDARITEEYVSDISLRMELYQRIGDAYVPEELEKLKREISDRFGPYPDSFLWLYHLARIKMIAGSKGFTSIVLKKNVLHVEKRTKEGTEERKTPFTLHENPEIFEQQLLKVLDFWQ